jgi:NADP-reducing hydrogenase subunit HndC
MVKENRQILRNAGKINPMLIDDYISSGGYETLKKVLNLQQDEILKTIELSGLKGRGGAGFPTGFKTQSTASSEAICLRYVVCNADEGEPGTFKDRIIMENDPHLLIEGMIIAGLAVGAIKGFIYIRAEYYQSIAILQNAISQAYDRQFLGDNICESKHFFHLELVPGAGSYLCGEELTLLESLEGKRGYPRIKPPFPAQKGLWQQPTLVNNVETLANLPILFRMGHEEYRKLGTVETSGTKLICLSGDINNPGTYEIEPGCTLREVIEDLGGGLKKGTKIKTVLTGGAAGTFAGEQQMDCKIGFSEMREHNLTLGSGAIIVLSESSSLTKTMTSIFDFFKHESCGKCVPCRIGTQHIADMWHETEHKSVSEKIDALRLIEKIAADIAVSSLCPLGQSPVLPVRSLLEHCSEQLEDLN